MDINALVPALLDEAEPSASAAAQPTWLDSLTSLWHTTEKATRTVIQPLKQRVDANQALARAPSCLFSQAIHSLNSLKQLLDTPIGSTHREKRGNAATLKRLKEESRTSLLAVSDFLGTLPKESKAEDMLLQISELLSKINSDNFDPAQVLNFLDAKNKDEKTFIELLNEKKKFQKGFVINQAEAAGAAFVNAVFSTACQKMSTIFPSSPTALVPLDEDGGPREEVARGFPSGVTLIKNLFGALSEYVRFGDSAGAYEALISTVIPGLEYLKQHLTAELNTAKSEEEIGKIQLTMRDLDKCLAIARNPVDTTSAGYEEALKQIKQIMRTHPIWIEGWFQLSFPGVCPDENVHPAATSKVIREELRLSEWMEEEEVVEDINYSNGIIKEIDEISRIGSFMSTYATAFSFFLGETPREGRGEIQSFPAIMQSLGGLEGGELRTAFIAKCRENIMKRKDILIFTRWFACLTCPLILKASEFAMDRVTRGAKRYLDEILDNLRTLSTGEATKTPLELLTLVINGLIEGDKLYKSNRSRMTDIKALMSVIEGKDFLGGHNSVAELCLSVGNIFIDKMHPIHTAEICDKGLLWLTSLTYRRYNGILTVAVLPFKTVLFLIKTLILSPIDWLSNKILKSSMKTILKKTSLVEKLTEVSIKALFPNDSDFTVVMDNILIKLLKRIGEQLNRDPSQEDASVLLLHEIAQNPKLEECIMTLFEYLHVRGKLPDISSSTIRPVIGKAINAVVGVVNRGYQVLMRKEVIEQHLFSLLQITHTSMVSEGSSSLSPEAREERKQAQLLRRSKILDHLKDVLSDSLLLAKANLFNSTDKDIPIQESIKWLKRSLLGTPVSPGASPVRAAAEYERKDDDIIIDEVPQQPSPLSRERSGGANNGHSVNGTIAKWVQILNKQLSRDSIADFREVQGATNQLLKDLNERINSKSLKEASGYSEHLLDLNRVINNICKFKEHLRRVYDALLYHSPELNVEGLTRIDGPINQITSALSNITAREQFVITYEDLGVLDAQIVQLEGCIPRAQVKPSDLRTFDTLLKTHIQKIKSLHTAMKNLVGLSELRSSLSDISYDKLLDTVIASPHLNFQDKKRVQNLNIKTQNDKEKVTSLLGEIYQEKERELLLVTQDNLNAFTQFSRASIARLEQVSNKINEPLDAQAPTVKKAIDALDDLELSVHSMRSISSIRLNLLQNSTVVDNITQRTHSFLTTSVDGSLNQLSGNPYLIRALIHKLYVHFLESNGIVLSNPEQR